MVVDQVLRSSAGYRKLPSDDYTVRSLLEKKEETERKLRRTNRQRRTLAFIVVVLTLAVGLLFALLGSRNKANLRLERSLREQSTKLAESQTRVAELSRQRNDFQKRLDRLEIRQQELLKARKSSHFPHDNLAMIAFAPRRSDGPFWNIWQEQDSDTPSFKPLRVLVKGGTKYSLFVDLSAVRYTTASSVRSIPIDALLKAALDQKEGSSTNIDLVLIPDGIFLELQTEKDKAGRIPINLKRWRAATKNDFSTIRDPFKYLEDKPDADFRFGHQMFGIQTKEKSGKGYIAISVWVDNKPVDEISVPICVVDSATEAAIAVCDQLPATEYSFKGVNPFSHGSLPDAALHLIQLNSMTLAGVFSCRDCPTATGSKYLTWVLRNSPTTLRDALNNQVVIPFEDATLKPDTASNSLFLNGGRALYNLIFQDNSGTVEPSAAEIAFRDFIKRVLQNEQTEKNTIGLTAERYPSVSSSTGETLESNGQKATRPSLFVRLLPESPEIAFAVPLDLMAVPISEGREEFVGFHVKVYSPLEVQDYSVPQSCINSWRLFVPGPDILDGSEMGRARQPFIEGIADFRAWRNHATVDFTVAGFDGWIGQRAESAQSTALVTLSHHSSGKLCFSDPACSRGESIKEANIWRGFPLPSLAVINACGTAAPGASEFVRHLNSRGIQTVIATSATVDGEMAGNFLQLLMDQLRASTNPLYTVSDAKFDAVKVLGKTYGPKALVYSFLGNDSLRACVPQRHVE